MATFGFWLPAIDVVIFRVIEDVVQLSRVDTKSLNLVLHGRSAKAGRLQPRKQRTRGLMYDTFSTFPCNIIPTCVVSSALAVLWQF